MNPFPPPLVVFNEVTTPDQLFHLPDALTEALLASLQGTAGLGTLRRTDPRRFDPRCSSRLHPTWGSQSRGVPRESLAALENLTKEAYRQVAFSQ